MQQIPWFDRKFDFSHRQNIFPSILERLRGTAIRIVALTEDIAADRLGLQAEGSWSIKQHIGHLTDLEPIWYGRMEDILAGEKWLREADLSNRLTHQAPHNERKLSLLIADFAKARNKTLKGLEGLSEKEVFISSLHPRLKQPLRMMDLFLFVAEHDDHHLARMREIKKL